MSLSAGTRLGPYEILSSLGAGGMGEVYRARDTRLERDVAIKRLSKSLAGDSRSLARFEREAKMLAALNHPHIAQIYGLEERDGERFLVLELVEGQSLEARLRSGPLRVPDALRLAGEIAEALAAAHEKGVIHRDLKPGNVMVTPDGRAKVLDFGLAKASQRPLDAAGREQAAAEHDPMAGNNITGLRTVAESQQLTRDGFILGTPAYMSPEQARGRTVDARTDLWSFGCLVYEMLTGRRAFSGETIPDCLASILQENPDWKHLPRTTPASVRRLILRCLEKDLERRFRDSRAAHAEILAALQTPRRAGARRTLEALRLTQLTIARTLEESPVFSPGGDEIAYAADSDGVRKIFVRRVSGGETPLTSGPHDDIQPAWSPDGTTVAFVRARQPRRRLEPAVVFGSYVEGDIWTIDRASGREARLVEDAYNPSFSPDGERIAFDAPWAGQRRLWTVDVHGHNPRQLTSDVSEAVAHLRPRWSPDGRRIVFQNKESTRFDLRVVDLGTQQLHWVTNDHFQDFQPVWSPSGRFIYFSSYRSGGLNLWRIGVTAGGKPRGAPQQLTTGAGQDLEPAVSPDSSRLAFAILRQNADLWVLPVDSSSGRPTGPPREMIATNREHSRGAWSPDGRAIAFNSDRGGEMNIWLHDLVSGVARQLTSGPGGDFQASWSPDGRAIAFFSSRSGTPDVWLVDVGSGDLRQLTQTKALDINPSFAPDGRSIAFQSDRSGRLEVWVMGADGSDPRCLTDTGTAGHFLLWAKDSKTLYYRAPGNPSRTMRIPRDGGSSQPTAEVAGGAHMSFSPDTSRIMDVVGHKELWVSPMSGGEPEKVFEFDDPDARIDYPMWSPDGNQILFDRFRPQGGDIWLMEGIE